MIIFIVDGQRVEVYNLMIKFIDKMVHRYALANVQMCMR